MRGEARLRQRQPFRQLQTTGAPCELVRRGVRQRSDRTSYMQAHLRQLDAKRGRRRARLAAQAPWSCLIHMSRQPERIVRISSDLRNPLRIDLPNHRAQAAAACGELPSLWRGKQVSADQSAERRALCTVHVFFCLGASAGQEGYKDQDAIRCENATSPQCENSPGAHSRGRAGRAPPSGWCCSPLRCRSTSPSREAVRARAPEHRR